MAGGTDSRWPLWKAGQGVRYPVPPKPVVRATAWLLLLAGLEVKRDPLAVPGRRVERGHGRVVAPPPAPPRPSAAWAKAPSAADGAAGPLPHVAASREPDYVGGGMVWLRRCPKAQAPVPVNMTLFGNRVSAQVQRRSEWIPGGPSPMAGVLRSRRRPGQGHIM